MEPGAVDLNLHSWSTEELAALAAAAGKELASRQTREAIIRDVTGVVDPIIRENRDLMGEAWQEGRVSWDGHCMTVQDPGEEDSDV